MKTDLPTRVRNLIDSGLIKDVKTKRLLDSCLASFIRKDTSSVFMPSEEQKYNHYKDVFFKVEKVFKRENHKNWIGSWDEEKNRNFNIIKKYCMYHSVPKKHYQELKNVFIPSEKVYTKLLNNKNFKIVISEYNRETSFNIPSLLRIKQKLFPPNKLTLPNKGLKFRRITMDYCTRFSNAEAIFILLGPSDAIPERSIHGAKNCKLKIIYINKNKSTLYISEDKIVHLPELFLEEVK